MTPRNVSAMGTSLARVLMMKTLRPTGGVISPSSTTTSARMPNQSFSASFDMPKAAVSAVT